MLKISLFAIAALLATNCMVRTCDVQAGEIPVVDLNNPLLPALPEPSLLKSADVDLFGMYILGNNDFEDTYSLGGSLGWKLNNIIGLETEYWYLVDPEIHNGALNGVLQIPMGNEIAVRPFLGGGIAGGGDMSGMAQGGIDLLWIPSSNIQVGIGYRYVYRFDYENYQGISVSLGFSF